MENKRGKSMNEKNTDHLLKLLDDLIKLVGKNTSKSEIRPTSPKIVY